MRDRLTPEQTRRFPEFIEPWIRIGLAASSIERPAAERALARLYAAAGLTPPRIVWVGCPLTAMLSAIACIPGGTGPEPEADDSPALGSVLERITAALSPTIPVAMHGRLALGIEAAMVSASSGPAVPAGYAAGVRIEHARGAELRRALDAALDPGPQARLRYLLTEPIRRGIAGLRTPVERALEAIGRRLVPDRLPPGAPMLGGSRSIGDAALLDYVNRVLGVELDRGFIEPAALCGDWWALDGVCFAAERPTDLNWDEAGQLHCEIGPSVAYPSGWSWWHWHGIRVPQIAIEAPERITIEVIHRARGPDRRRVMIERYRAGEAVAGIAAYLRDSGARPLDSEPRFGTLWQIETAEDAPMLMIEVENRSPEPDGGYRHFLLRLHPELRPLLADGGLGAPQPPTVRNAVASTFGLRGGEYAPEIET